MHFFYPIHIPSLDSVRYFKELTCEYYKAFLKIILNDNAIAYEMFIDELLTDLCRDDLDVTKLTVFDKFVIMLEIRATNISPVIEFNIPIGDKENRTYKIELNDCLEICRSYDIEHTFNIDLQELKIQGTLPRKMIVKDWFEVGVHCITDIQFKGKNIPVSTLPLEEQEHVISHLPSSVLPSILEYIKRQIAAMGKQHLVQLPGEDKSGDMEDIFISPIDGSIPSIIKMMYNMNLMDIYSAQMALMHHCKLDYAFIANSTPAEIQLYFRIAEEEAVNRQSQQQQDQQAPSKPSMPTPPQGIA
jgi:hypothetical protein